MKKIILNITLLCSLSLSVYSQSICNPNAPFSSFFNTGPNVSTCNGGTIYADTANCEWSDPQIKTMKSDLLAIYGKGGIYGAYGIDSIDLLAPASVKYNCHAYAWHLTEGNSNKVWINGIIYQDPYTGCYVSNGNLETYWSGAYACFVEVYSESEAEKIHYYCGDHSAVNLSVAGKYESKWGPNFLVRHYPTTVPYTNPSSRKYYKRIPPPPPSITGPSSVCPGSSGTFTAHNFPGTVTWTCSSNLTILSSNENTATVTNPKIIFLSQPSSNESQDNSLSRHPLFPCLFGPQAGWVRATLNGTSVFVEINFTTDGVCVDAIDTYSISVAPSGNMIYTLTPVTTGPAEIRWDLTPAGGLIVIHSDNSYITFEVTQQVIGSFTVKATATNACSSQWCSRTFAHPPCPNCPDYPNGVISVYPNPTSNILNIKIDEEVADRSATVIQTGTTYDIRLYDGQGTLLRQRKTKGGVVQFNVSNLLNGIYYLHIYDGVSDTPEMRQIVVEH